MKTETFAELQLKPHGFTIVKRGPTSVVVRHKRTGTIQLDCACPAYPTIKAAGCPLHAEVPGSSWPITRLIEQAYILPVGTRVHTVAVANLSPNWTASAKAARRFGVAGIVVAVHQACGLWYSVRHSDDKTVAYYDPHELETAKFDHIVEDLLK